MDLNKFLVKNTDGKTSLTATLFVVGSAIVNLKLILSGMEIGPVNLAAFSGTEYAAAMAALGGVYVLRRSNEPKTKRSRNMESRDAE